MSDHPPPPTAALQLLLPYARVGGMARHRTVRTHNIITDLSYRVTFVSASHNTHIGQARLTAQQLRYYGVIDYLSHLITYWQFVTMRLSFVRSILKWQGPRDYIYLAPKLPATERDAIRLLGKFGLLGRWMPLMEEEVARLVINAEFPHVNIDQQVQVNHINVHAPLIYEDPVSPIYVSDVGHEVIPIDLTIDVDPAPNDILDYGFMNNAERTGHQRNNQNFIDLLNLVNDNEWLENPDHPDYIGDIDVDPTLDEGNSLHNPRGRESAGGDE
jgi:hypothetical protein